MLEFSWFTKRYLDIAVHSSLIGQCRKTPISIECENKKNSKIPHQCPCSMNLRASSTAINAKHIYSVLLTILIYLSLSFPAQHIKRTGWLLRNVNDCETVAGHMYRMSIMTFLLDGKNGLDRTKCMELGKLSPYRRNRPNRQWLNIYKSSCTHHNWHMTSIITVSPHYVRANKPSQAKHAKQQQNKLKAENRKMCSTADEHRALPDTKCRCQQKIHESP